MAREALDNVWKGTFESGEQKGVVNKTYEKVEDSVKPSPCSNISTSLSFNQDPSSPLPLSLFPESVSSTPSSSSSSSSCSSSSSSSSSGFSDTPPQIFYMFLQSLGNLIFRWKSSENEIINSNTYNNEENDKNVMENALKESLNTIVEEKKDEKNIK
jgi:hypothetical protein